MPKVSLHELADALDFIGSEEYPDNAVFLCRQSGRLYFQSDDVDGDEELPEHLDDSALYLPLPTRRDLDLGAELAFTFAATHLSAHDCERVYQCFDRRGGFAFFKQMLDRQGLLHAWLQFEDDAVRTALAEWCQLKGLQATD